MAVISKDVSARISLADEKMKTVASYSGVDIGVDPDSVIAFRNGINDLTAKNISNQFVIITSELEEEAE